SRSGAESRRDRSSRGPAVGTGPPFARHASVQAEDPPFMSSLRLSEEPGAGEEDCAAIVRGLRDYNERYMARSVPEPIRLFLRDESGAIRGGLLASTRWHWLLIDVLWVADEHRGKGLGSSLLERAEGVARGRGCRAAMLDTREFQARPFYERAGYRVFGEVED